MVKREVIWSVRAVNDKRAIYDYWTNRNQSTSYPKKLEQVFKQALNRVAEYPFSGRDTEKREIRVLIETHFNIFYSFSS